MAAAMGLDTNAMVQAATFAALGEPSRLRIVELLRGGPRSVGEIVDSLGIRQPQVSKHLRVLGDSGIVAMEPRQRQRIYRLQRERFDAVAHWAESFEQLWETRLDSLGTYLHSLATEGNPDGNHTDR